MQRKAYTLLELLLVLAILVIVAGLSYPTIRSAYTSYKVRAGTDAVRTGFAHARGHAIGESRRYRFSYLTGKGNFRVAPDAPEFWSGNAPPVDDNNPAFIYEGVLPNGITFNIQGAPVDKSGPSSLPPESVTPDQYVTLAIFESDGTSHGTDKDDVFITLSLQDDDGQDIGQPLTVSLRGLTGTSTVRKGS
jgi:prepilin-type N-terminal cleavage/methylation domain-containing protein